MKKQIESMKPDFDPDAIKARYKRLTESSYAMMLPNYRARARARGF